MKPKPRFIDMTNLQFGNLKVLRPAPSRKSSTDKYWHCICGCGNETIVNGSNLRRGKSKSCGCMGHNIKHGYSGTTHRRIRPEYSAWKGMRSRCNNQSDRWYYRYGARGISVCQRWSKFENFIADMGDKPSPHHTLDRIDNNGPYSPENCRWATHKQQNRNKQDTRAVNYHGQLMSLAEACERANLSLNTVHRRIYTGWSESEALTTPAGAKQSARYRLQKPVRKYLYKQTGAAMQPTGAAESAKT